MILLPAIPELVLRAKALAALDLILSPEWQYRYYSFNSVWSPTEQTASMKDGSGNEWWLVFHSDGWAALKGLAPDSEAWSKNHNELSKALQSAIPADLADFANERAFRWDSTSFAYFRLPNEQSWQRANDLTPYSALDSGEANLFRHLSGTPADYAAFAQDYYEKTVPVEIVGEIFKGAAITEEIVAALNPDITLQDIAEQLYDEIGYPR